ncbi:28S ribosomal protein S5, mitochondrial [Physocladia obscura]|uniref:28S ribosomal protein S5, mitochondrial n=1 Tax=Physocladia obscura TaxID=109957 RepID=A0AAD5X863_9FUNG|nr:28S ribosomal protein S5, mitochondrial [Physocladia obscura]
MSSFRFVTLARRVATFGHRNASNLSSSVVTGDISPSSSSPAASADAQSRQQQSPTPTTPTADTPASNTQSQPRPQSQQRQKSANRLKKPVAGKPDGVSGGGGGGGSSSDLQKRVLHVRQVSRSTKGGKIRTTSAIVVVGNGNGVGGYGEGRAADRAGAISKATAVAAKNMTVIPRFQQRTVYGDIVHRYHAVRLDIKTAPPGFGIVANDNIHEICRCIGIRDLAAKVRGSTNPLNVIKGTFEALLLQKTPVQIAQARGRKLIDIANAYYGGKI